VFISGIEQESRGMIVASQGDHRQALRLYLGCGRLLGTNGLENPACSAWRSRAVVTMVGLGMAWEARTLGEAEVELARSWGAPGPLSRALAAAATTRELPQRLEMLHEAVGILDGTECVLDLARAQIRFGRAQLEGGDTSAARTALARGLDIAVSCGMRRMAAAARQALQAAGGEPAMHNGHPVLTASELRVAELVIQGLGNQEVAVQLSISKRTVDTHLGRIYRKLHISGRNRLREALRGVAS
jgi:DNA-binding CsgD family transcriptional regulator